MHRRFTAGYTVLQNLCGPLVHGHGDDWMCRLSLWPHLRIVRGYTASYSSFELQLQLGLLLLSGSAWNKEACHCADC